MICQLVRFGKSSECYQILLLVTDFDPLDIHPTLTLFLSGIDPGSKNGPDKSPSPKPIDTELIRLNRATPRSGGRMLKNRSI